MAENEVSRADAFRDLEHELGATIQRIRRAIATRARMVHADLPAASYTMLASLHDDGHQRSSELAERFSIDKGAVSRQVATMEELGLVERAPDPEDGRAQLLRITELGVERFEQVDRERRTWYESQLADLSAQELADLARTLARYNAALEPRGDTSAPGASARSRG